MRWTGGWLWFTSWAQEVTYAKGKVCLESDLLSCDALLVLLKTSRVLHNFVIGTAVLGVGVANDQERV